MSCRHGELGVWWEHSLMEGLIERLNERSSEEHERQSKEASDSAGTDNKEMGQFVNRMN